MQLLKIVRRSAVPFAWTEGDNIPWNEAEFSARMLEEHLSQAHDLASRRSAKIAEHVDWIHCEVLGGKPTRILDLCCGPGLYSNRLAERGHECHGIDYSPASVAYAADESQRQNLRSSFVESDIRHVDYGSGYGLVLLIYGELNVFRPSDANAILGKAHAALDDGGLLLLEPHTFDAVRAIGEEGRHWDSSEAGLFSDRPYLCLQENHWDAERRTATRRYFIIHAETGDVSRCAVNYQAYSDERYREWLVERGFTDVRTFPSLTGKPDDTQTALLAILAKKPAEGV